MSLTLSLPDKETKKQGDFANKSCDPLSLEFITVP